MGLHAPLMIGNNSLYAGVDTGSVGLRVLESAIADKTGITITSESESYSYQDGVSLTGLVAIGPVTIGGVTENIKFMLITNVSCFCHRFQIVLRCIFCERSCWIDGELLCILVEVPMVFGTHYLNYTVRQPRFYVDGNHSHLG